MPAATTPAEGAEVQRINVLGSSGVGKTTLARRLAEAIEAPHTELDALNHLAGWVEEDHDRFRAKVAVVASGDRWVVCGSYSRVRDVLWARADTVVFLDLPRRVVMGRLVRRTIQRVVTRQELWNGNVEVWDNLWRPDPANNIILWSWTRFHLQRERWEVYVTDPRWSHVRFVRLTTDRAVDALVDRLRQG